ncbi:MAG: hypothetical protein V4707_09715 [Pseudomonadota bacterium]
MGPDHHDIRQGVKLALVAVVSAVATATLVIGAGHALMGEDRAAVAASAEGRIILASSVR